MDILEALNRIIVNVPTAYAVEITAARDEIERLRGVLVEANNRWRHDFDKEVEDATEKLFKKLAAHRTDPFGRKAA